MINIIIAYQYLESLLFDFNINNKQSEMTSVQQILREPDNYSDLSIDASFTLEDVLQQPADQSLQQIQNIQEIENIDALFDYEIEPTFEENKSSKEVPVISSNLEANENLEILNNHNSFENVAQLNQVKAKPNLMRRWARLSDLPLPQLENIRNMIYIGLKNVSQLFEISNSQSKGVGVPTCISTSGNKFLALGTSLGNLIIFQIGVKGHRILSTNDQYKYGQTTSISVSRDNRYLVAGYQTGLVVLWDLYSFKVVKTILLHKNRILKVLFCSQNFQNFVSSDCEGYLYMYTIENYLWTGVKTQLMIDRSQNIYYDIKYSKLKSGRQILALSTFNSILLLVLKPTIAVLGSIQRPEGISSKKIPNCQIGEGQQKSDMLKQTEQRPKNTNSKNKDDYVCVSWGRFIYIYLLVYSNSQMQTIHHDFVIEQPSGIHNMEFITNGIVVTLDNRQVYRVINLIQEKSKLKNDSKTISATPIHVAQLQAQTIYQRYMKDKQGKYIKSYSNTIVSCCHNPRYKQIFMISKNAVYRGRLQKWTDYIHFLLTEQQSWQLALKLCLQLYKGNYRIFAQPFVISKSTIDLLCDIGKIFFKQRIKQIQKKRTQLNTIDQVKDEAKCMFEITIQFFATINCEDFLFLNIYKTLKQKYFFEYDKLFIDSLQIFIEQSLINRIPSRQNFIVVVQHYSKKPLLLNKLIISLHQESLYFQDIVELCTKQKLFESLSYICSVNGDFISPGNKMVAHLQQNPHDKVQYNNLKSYLDNLIDLRYPNGKPITKNRHNMLKDLSIWLSCDQTLTYMIKNYPDDYFLMLSRLTTRLIENQLLNQIPNLAAEVINRIEVIKQSNLLLKMLQYLMQVGLSTKIHFSQELITKVLNASVQLFAQHKTSEFKKQFKYTIILRFIEKYLLDKHDNCKDIRSQFQQKLLPKLNIWVRLAYKMISGSEKQQILKETPELLKNDDPGRDASISYLFDHSFAYSQIIEKYQDLLIQWSPEKSLIYIIQTKKTNGIKQINKNVMNIGDQKLRYAVIRKILRLLRQKNKERPKQPNNEVRKIIRASIKELHNPIFDQIANQIVDTTLGQDILYFYLSSICKYKDQKRVFYELTQNQDEYRPMVNMIQDLMKKYNYQSCLGFIYEQQLKFKEAFKQYELVYHQCFEQNFKSLIAHQYCHGRFMNKVFQIMLDISLRIKKQQQWGALVSAILSPLQKADFTSRIPQERIIDTIQSIYEKKHTRDHPFMQHLIYVIELSLTSMSRQVSIGFMAIQLNKYTDLLNKSFIVNSLTSTLRNCGKRLETFDISRKLMIAQFVKDFEEFYNINKIKGSSTQVICNECDQQCSSRNYNSTVQQIKFEVLKCGHGYHSKCFQKNYFKCKVCTRKAYGDIQKDERVKEKTQILKQRSFVEESLQVKEIEMDGQQSDEIYKYLSLQDYRKQQEEDFEAFIEQYQGYIRACKHN